MRAALYIRVSTDEQAREGYSIDAQKNRLTQYCQINDHEIVGIFIDDGVSAKNLNRPEIQKIISEIKHDDNCIEAIIVYKLDRITRSMQDLIYLLNLFQQKNIAFTSLTENIDTSTAVGRMFVFLLGIFAQWERETTAERVEFGIDQRAISDGIYHSSHIPFGYDFINEKYVPNIKEAEIVKKVFKLYVEGGKGALAIAGALQNANAKTKAGAPFFVSNVHRMIKNNIYRGYFLYCKHRKEKKQIIKATNIEPIIDNETFLKAKQIYESRSKSKAKKYAQDIFIFHPKMRCICGLTMRTKIAIRNKNTIDYYYHCVGYQRHKCTSRKYINSNTAEKIFTAYLTKIAYKDIKVDLEVNHGKVNDTKKRQELYNADLEQCMARKRRLQYLFLDDKIDNNSYLGLLSEFDLLERQLVSKIRECEEEIKSLDNIKDLEKAKTVAVNILDKWNGLTIQGKKEFIGRFVENIIIENGNIIEINFIL